MKTLISVSFFFFAFLVTSYSQTFNFSLGSKMGEATIGWFEAIEQALQLYPWLEDNEENVTIDGQIYPVLHKSSDGSPVVLLKPKYVVYLASLDSPGTITIGTTEFPAYPTKKGKFVVFVPSKSGGIYAKYITPQ